MTITPLHYLMNLESTQLFKPRIYQIQSRSQSFVKISIQYKIYMLPFRAVYKHPHDQSINHAQSLSQKVHAMPLDSIHSNLKASRVNIDTKARQN